MTFLCTPKTTLILGLIATYAITTLLNHFPLRPVRQQNGIKKKVDSRKIFEVPSRFSEAV